MGILLFSCAPTRAQDPALQSLAGAAEEQAAHIGASEALARFKSQVEADALGTTYQLCPGYRRLRYFFSWGAPGDFAPSSEVALRPWARIYRKGLMSALGLMFGERAKYAELMKESSVSLDYWFQSLYVLYLIESNGFLEGAMNCLNTMDQREINRFAKTILLADSIGAVQSQAASYWLIGETLGLFGAGLKLAFPATFDLVAALTARITKTPIVVGGTIVIPFAIDVFNQRMEAIDQARLAGEEGLRPSPEHKEMIRESERQVLLDHGHDLLKRVLKGRNQGSRDREAELEFETFLQQQLSSDKIPAYEADLEKLSASPVDLDQGSERYLQLLQLLLPIARANHS